jgi:cytochrome d ubiquinol oxidase subunit I
MEANWKTGPNIPLVLFAWPDEAAKENHFEIAIPNGAFADSQTSCRWRGARP